MLVSIVPPLLLRRRVSQLFRPRTSILRFNSSDPLPPSPTTPYPSFTCHVKPTPFNRFITHYTPLVPNPKSILLDHSCALAGRISSIRHTSSKLVFFTLKTAQHSVQIVGSRQYFSCDSSWASFIDALHLGDIAYVSGFPGRTNRGELSLYASQFQTLSPTLRDIPFKQGIADPERRSRNRVGDLLTNPILQSRFLARAKLINELRHSLISRGCIELDTPILSSTAGGANAKPFITKSDALSMDLYLRVAPELFLKQLVIAGFDRVFEIGRQFRNEGTDALHHPEFTSCEAYFAYSNLDDLIFFTQEIVSHLAMAVAGGSKVSALALDSSLPVIDFTPPYNVIDVVPFLESILKHELPDLECNDSIPQLKAVFEKHNLSLPPNPHTVPRLIDALISHWIIPKCIQPTFIRGHPRIMSPLAKSDKNNAHFIFFVLGTTPKIAARLELFIAGQELVNAYEELNDPNEQRARFVQQQQHKNEGDEEAQPLDEGYCQALEYGLPPTAGWGLGIDRLVMLLTGAHHIREVIPFPIVKPKLAQPHLLDPAACDKSQGA